MNRVPDSTAGTTSYHRPIRVFSDFDGTISLPDVGATLFNHFAGQRNYGTVRLWMEGRISSRECLTRECTYITASREEMVAKLNQIEVRTGFNQFLELLNSNAIPLHIVSDGLDFYINAFLDKSGLHNLDVYSNRACFIHQRLYPVFPYFDKGCGFCGTCKGERMESLSKDGELKVFIGDGYSDRCALGVADLVFARADLAKLCREKEIDYLSFNDFLEIADYFKRNLLQ
ncbi:MAG: MtnX-like HAD-IB family phosphatase [candidate division Zixibacteria bacterium]|nr:MtnX-like HAD-IB family phosphatase [candidate division Zixibacteria bacterium]